MITGHWKEVPLLKGEMSVYIRNIRDDNYIDIVYIDPRSALSKGILSKASNSHYYPWGEVVNSDQEIIFNNTSLTKLFGKFFFAPKYGAIIRCNNYNCFADIKKIEINN